MGTSKQLSTNLKTKIIHYHELGEGYKKFQEGLDCLSPQSEMWCRNGRPQEVLVKERCGRPKKHTGKAQAKDG